MSVLLNSLYPLSSWLQAVTWSPDHFSCPFLFLVYIHYTLLDLGKRDLNVVSTVWVHTNFTKQGYNKLCLTFCSLLMTETMLLTFWGLITCWNYCFRKTSIVTPISPCNSLFWVQHHVSVFHSIFSRFIRCLVFFLYRSSSASLWPLCSVLLGYKAFDCLIELNIICNHKYFTIFCFLKGIDDNIK